jgi:hypothetical protein
MARVPPERSCAELQPAQVGPGELGMGRHDHQPAAGAMRRDQIGEACLRAPVERGGRLVEQP